MIVFKDEDVFIIRVYTSVDSFVTWTEITRGIEGFTLRWLDQIGTLPWAIIPMG
jgi:hypothetical protein